MRLCVSHEFLPKQNSLRASVVMDHFGIDFEQGRHVIADGLELPIRPGQVVLFTGASGSGKSSLLRAVCSQLRAPEPRDLRIGPAVDPIANRAAETSGAPDQTTGAPSEFSADSSPPADRPALLQLDDLDLGTHMLIDALPGAPEDAMQLLSQCGLGEARLLLRTPHELSDGQRCRFRLALGISRRPLWLAADEFSATLDRTLARVISFNVRRLADRTGIGFLLATTHEDVIEDLQPDVLVRRRLDGATEIVAAQGGAGPAERAATPAAGPVVCGAADEQGAHAQSTAAPGVRGRKKKASASPETCGSVWRPSATGRTSLGGITAATTWDS